MKRGAGNKLAQKPPTGGQLQNTVDKSGRAWSPPALGKMSRPAAWESALGSMDFCDPSHLPIKLLKQMEEMDETISSGLEFITLSVLDQLGPYRVDNSRAQKYIDSFWDNAETNFDEFVEEMMSHLTFGRYVGELVPRVFEDRLYLKEIAGLDPQHYHFVLDDKQRVSGVRGSICTEMIPKEKLVICSHRSRYGNPYGRSRLVPIYKWWALGTSMAKTWGMALDLHGMPVSVAKVKSPEVKEMGADGVARTRKESVSRALNELRGGSSIVIGEQDDVTISKLSSQVNGDFEGFMNFCNKMKLRGLLLPSLMWEPTDVGSFALGKKQFEIFLRGVARLARQLRNIISQQIYRPFLYSNFGTSCPIGEFVNVDVDEDELKVWAEIFYSLVNSGFLKSSQQDDLDAVRSRFKFSKANAADYPDIKTPSNGLPGGQAPGGSEGSGPAQPRPTPRNKTKPEGRPKK